MRKQHNLKVIVRKQHDNLKVNSEKTARQLKGKKVKENSTTT